MGCKVQINNHVADTSAEAIAYIQEIQFARDISFQYIEVEGDFRTTIIKAQKGILDKFEIGVHITEIQSLALTFKFISFQHAKRAANSMAHTLARNGFNKGDTQFWVAKVPEDARELRYDLHAFLFLGRISRSSLRFSQWMLIGVGFSFRFDCLKA